MSKSPARRRKRTTSVARPVSTARKPTTSDQIVRVTLRRIRRGGFASVSMRQVAKEVGISATALYHHFRDKDDLLDRVAELINDSIPTPDPARHWTVRLRELVLAQERAMLDHPGLARFVLTRRANSRGAFKWIESILAVLRQGGLNDAHTLLGLAQLAYLINPLTFLDVPQRQSSARKRPSRRVELEGLQEFPNLASLMDVIPDHPSEEQFSRALDGVIAGLRAQVERTNDAGSPTAAART